MNKYLLFDDTPEEVYLVVENHYAYYHLRWLQESADGYWYWGLVFRYTEDEPCSVTTTLPMELMPRVYEAFLNE